MNPRNVVLLLAAVVAAVLSAGCAGYSPNALPVGATVADIAASMGPPTGRYALPGGAQRLEYARGPMGRHTYMIDLDAQGRLATWQQVLVENNFNAILAGTGRDEVLARIGHPANVGWLPRQRHQLWSYRYETPFCQWFQVSLDVAGKVAETGYGPDPACDRDLNDGFP